MKTFKAKINVAALDDLQWDQYCRRTKHSQVTSKGSTESIYEIWIIQAYGFGDAAAIVQAALKDCPAAFLYSLTVVS